MLDTNVIKQIGIDINFQKNNGWSPLASFMYAASKSLNSIGMQINKDNLDKLNIAYHQQLGIEAFAKDSIMPSDYAIPKYDLGIGKTGKDTKNYPKFLEKFDGKKGKNFKFILYMKQNVISQLVMWLCVKEWSGKYPISYDEQGYFPYILNARNGDKNAIEKLTQWKNGRPRGKLSKNKEKSLNGFLQNLGQYYNCKNGKENLKNNYKNKAPVWSIFWSHILYGTPIFDKNTYASYHYLTTGEILSKKQAIIKSSKSWDLLDKYTEWFNSRLGELKKIDITIDDRVLDRALFEFGKNLLKNKI